MVFLVIIGIINQRYVLRIIPYVRDNKPYENFTVKDFSSFWITVVAAGVQVVLRRVWKTLTLPFWVSIAKGKDDPDERAKHG